MRAQLFLFAQVFVGFLTAGELRAAPLSWQASVAEALEANSDVRAANEKLRAAEYATQGSYSAFFPQLNASLTYTRTKGVDTFNLADPVNRYGATLSASQNLFNGFQDRARVDQARASREAAEASAASAKAKASYDLKSAYAGLLYAQRSVLLQGEIERRRGDNLRLVELRFNSGRENKGSVLLSRAYLRQARHETLQAQNAARTSLAHLARVLGWNGPREVELSEEVPSAASLEQLDFRAMSLQTPDRRQALAQEASSAAGVALARGAFFPTLGLDGSRGRQGTTWFPANDRWSFGVTLSLPLFSGGRDYYATRGAAATSAAATITREGVDREQVAKLEQTYAAFLEARSKVEVEEAFLEAAKTRSEIARNKYNNGLSSFDDWDLIENDLIQRQKSVLLGRRERVIAEAAYEQAQGKGVLP